MSQNENTYPIPLSKALIDRRYKVLAVNAGGAVRQRMLDMGLVPGVNLAVVRYAPLGDPIEIRIRHFLMSLRKEEAQDVMVLDLGPVPHRGRMMGPKHGFGRLRHFHGE